jgi:formate C-acetyltransferase
MLEQYLRDKRAGRIPAERARKGRWALMARDHYDANIRYADMQSIIREMQEHFADEPDLTKLEIAREIEWHFNFDYGQETRELMEELPWAVANHLDLNYGRAVRRGLGDILIEVEERLEATRDEQKRTFYESTRIAMRAAIDFIGRYAHTLRERAQDPDVSDARSSELREMADVLQKVSTERPETFREGVQLVWILHIIANIGGGSAMSFARFDEYMGPLYEADREAGRISEDQARELLACVWLKVNEPKMRTVQSICLGGTHPDGSDAANDLTRLCLEVSRTVRTPYPNTSVRFSEMSPEWLYDEAVETIKCGHGQPMVLNDDRWIPNFVELGYALEDARQYYNMGCVEMMLQGTMPNWGGGGGGIDFPGLLELVLRPHRHDGGAGKLRRLPGSVLRADPPPCAPVPTQCGAGQRQLGGPAL